jgi:hypothetical protein
MPSERSPGQSAPRESGGVPGRNVGARRPGVLPPRSGISPTWLPNGSSSRRRQGVGEAGRRIPGLAGGGDGRTSRQCGASPAVLPGAPDQREEGIAERDHPAGRAMRGTKGRARIGGARAPRRAHAGEARPLHPVGNGAGGGALGAGRGSPDESSSDCRDDEPLDSDHDAPPGPACRTGVARVVPVDPSANPLSFPLCWHPALGPRAFTNVPVRSSR